MNEKFIDFIELFANISILKAHTNSISKYLDRFNANGTYSVKEKDDLAVDVALTNNSMKRTIEDIEKVLREILS